MIGAQFWQPQSPTKLKKCSEFTLNAECPKAVFDDCCAVISCDMCLEFDVYGEDLRTGIASFNGTEYSGSIAGAAFLLWVQRNYDTDECESVATLDGEEIDVLTCYDGMSCRNLSGSAEVTIGYDTGTLSWTKIEPKPLEHITDADTGCKTWFCDECECTCGECLCVTITDSYDTVTEGEICDTTYDCDTPIWEGTVGDYVLSIALGRDDYGQCIITATVDGVEQAAVLAPGCGEMVSTIVLADGTTIAVRCKRCGCVPEESTCCGLSGVEELTLIYTGISTGWGAGETIGIRYTIWTVTLTAAQSWSRTDVPNPYDPTDLYAVSLSEGGSDEECLGFSTASWWGGGWGRLFPVGTEINEWHCPASFGVMKQYALSPPETTLDGYYTDIEITIA